MITFPVNELVPLCSEFGVKLTAEQLAQFNNYGNMLLDWNSKINLTAITDPYDIVYKHFYDCLLLLKNVNIPEGAAVIDIGTGAGFPGVVLKIARPDIELTLMDGLNKRLIFLNELLSGLSLTAKTIHARAEEAGQKPEYREKFDFATARAVAKLNVLYEYCTPFLKTGGSFVALKGPAVNEEIANSERAAQILGCSNPKVFKENLMGGEERNIVLVKKISQTPPKYPRISAKISKQPL